MTVPIEVLAELQRLARIVPEGSLPMPPPEDFDRVRQGVRDYVTGHPFCSEYVRVRDAHAARGEGFRNTEAWHALGERLQAALMTAFANSDDAQGRITADVDQAYALGLGMWMLRATPYLWRTDIFQIANAAPLPKHTISRGVLPYPLMFWSLETAYGNAADTSEEPRGDFNWMFVMLAQDQIAVVWDETRPPDSIHIRTGGIPFGAAWPNDVPEDERPGIGFVLKLCAFLSSPLIDTGGTRLSRADRRRLARSGRPLQEQEEPIHVVKLRRPEHHDAGDHDGQGDVTWRHQWWVTGHYRAQWYPSLDAHKVIWIAPHLKGPDGKPILEKLYDVAR